jgi:hypothetical protein
MKAAMLFAGVLMLGATPSALAYRPFDGTDADVAKAGEFELELGPVGRLREGGRRFLVAPAAVANFGLAGDRELVIEGRREVAREDEPGEPHSALVDNGIFLKRVLRRGVLQDAGGPSVATELGVLLPGVRGDHGTGLSAAGIVSQRSELAAVHLNGALAVTREHEPQAFLGVIVEGPRAWRLRPVAEVFTEHERAAERAGSALIGAIWRVAENLSFDAGWRSARTGSEAVHELRLGLTWTFSYRRE